MQNIKDYQIVLLSKDFVSFYPLHQGEEGRFWIYENYPEKRGHIVEIWGKNNHWYLLHNQDLLFPKGFPAEKKVTLSDTLYLYRGQEKFILLIENAPTMPYKRYSIHENECIEIGRNQQSTIYIPNTLISATHAIFSYQQDHWYIEDCNSTNGLYLNHHRIQKEKLFFGDCISILQYQIYMGKGYIMMSSDIDHIQLSTYKPVYDNSACRADKEIRKGAFPILRSKELILELELPPEDSSHDKQSFLVTNGSALIMGLSSLAMGMFMLYNTLDNEGTWQSAAPGLVMSFSMALSMIVWPIIQRRMQRKQNTIKQQEIEIFYLVYLKNMEKKIADQIQEEKIFRETQYETTKLACQYVTSCSYKLHHRMIEDTNFLLLCIGISSRQANIRFTGQKEPFLHTDSTSWQAYHTIQRDHHLIQDSPVMMDLKKDSAVGILGNYQRCEAYLMDKILQLILLHDREAIRICIIIKKAKADTYGISYVPQCNHNGIRLLLCESERGAVVQQALIQWCQEQNDQYLLICSFQPQYEYGMALTSLFTSPKVIYLQIADSRQSLHPFCKKIINIENTDMKVEMITPQQMRSILHIYQGYKYTSVCSHGYPTAYSFLDLFQCGNVEQLCISKRWKKVKGTTLQVPIGIDENHNVIYLDAHEKAHGPHGLIAGMTGSGKSEWLLTYILSLAIQFSPWEVNFILIDYKGGGMSQAFQDLPHVVGVMTNLTASNIQRCSKGIENELVRRQKKFVEARDIMATNIMNIDHYNKVVKESDHLHSLSHLFIIADEFAELKLQHPEFMDHLKQISRIGRSLGIHLFLATQKPSGIVDEQIWSNARLHICLKVQDKMDSMDMLKKADAAYLNEPGRFIFQVGYDDLYLQGQCAWANAPYHEKANYHMEQNDRLSIITASGMSLFDKHLLNYPTLCKTQLESITMSIMHQMQSMPVHKQILWQQELPLSIKKQELLHNYHDTSIIALADDIDNQCYLPIKISTQSAQNYLFLSENEQEIDMILAAMQDTMYSNHSYVIISDRERDVDYGFDDVIDLANTEKIQSLFYQLQNNPNFHKHKIGLTYIVLLDYTAFISTYEDIAPTLFLWMRKRDFSFIIFMKDTSQLNYRFMELITEVYCLHLKNKNEYQAVFLNVTCPKFTENIGRGWRLLDDDVMEIQIVENKKMIKKDKSDIYSIPTLPSKVIYQSKAGNLYLGKEIITKSDYWFSWNDGQKLLLLCKKHFYKPFINILKQTIETEFQTNLKLETIATFLTYERAKQEAFLQNYKILWNGEGLMEYAYLFNMLSQDLRMTEKEGILWEQNHYIKLQLVESF